jgi:hypothetical protein
MEINMNKKHFLFLLPVCLVFCLWFTTCEEEAVVTDLWEKIRNSIWTNEKTLNHNGEDYVVAHTLGFFKPNNGPFPNNNSVYPYVVIRFIVTGNVPEWWMAGAPYDKVFEMQINRTGSRITSVDEWINYSGKEFSPSFHLSISDNGEKLSVSGANLWDIWDAERFEGTYTKVTSGPYNWGNGSGGDGTLTKPDFASFLDKYRSVIPGSSKLITEIIGVYETYLRIEDNDYPPAYLDFEISKWEKAETPSTHLNDYPIAFKVTGIITDAIPKQNGPPYLYGNRTAPGFTIDDINSTECWMYLYFDYDGEELLRTRFSKAGDDEKNVFLEVSNIYMPRVYRRY